MHNFKGKKYVASIRLIVFIIVFFIINEIITFFLVPAGSFSRWVEYDAVTPKDSYDLVAIGSSELLRSWDSNRADELLGIHTFNMGSSSTILEAGVYITFKNIMAYQNPKRVLIMVNRYSMTGEKIEHPRAYIGVASYLSNPSAKVKYFFRTLQMGGTMKRIFPWLDYRVSSLQDMFHNVKTKLSKKYLEYDTELVQSSSVTYRGKGFCPLVVSEKNMMSLDNLDDKKLQKKEKEGFENKECVFLEQKITALKDMISLCKKRGCEVIVLASPIPITSVYSTNYYLSFTHQLKELAEGEGADYYDINFAKPELWKSEIRDFYDQSHVNENGATKFTEAICELLKRKDAGEDISNLFYQTWEEYLASIDYIVATYTLTKKVDKEIIATAYSVTGTEVIPEYKFTLIEGEKETILQEFDKNNVISIPTNAFSNKETKLRVYSRMAGEDNLEFVRYYDKTIKK